jgi:hypothetical protein
MSTTVRFDPGSYSTFRIVGREYDPGTRTITFRYGLDDRLEFTETITFERAPGESAQFIPPGSMGPGFERALLHLHVAAGTSYYKTAAPPGVVVEGESLSATELALHQHLYDDGLREFAVANDLPVPRPVTVVAGRGLAGHSMPPEGALPSGLLVPIGGGKDSMVLIEAVRHLRPRLFAVNPHPLVHELAAEAELELLVVRRYLDPGLSSLLEAGALNGHVPITAIVSLIAVVGAFVYGYDTVAMAVERSASEETVVVNGVPVNHQYSKSREFEMLLGDLVRSSVAPELNYGSALRPYSELAISRAFSHLDRYHSTFCSCNSAFRLRAGTDDRWCGHCPKCRFVGLMLAPFMERAELTTIIGSDMFADLDQVDGFAALMSDADKPFECVGEKLESAVAVRLLADRHGWRDAPVIAALAPTAAALVGDDDEARVLAPDHGLAFRNLPVATAVEDLLSRRG